MTSAKKKKEITYEEAVAKYEKTGICDWCDDTREVVVDIWDSDSHHYQPTSSAPCPVCCHEEEDPDSYKDNEEDR